MTSTRINDFISKVENILYWTLRGGNDPSNGGSVVDTVDELGKVMIEILKELKVEIVENREALSKSIAAEVIETCAAICDRAAEQWFPYTDRHSTAKTLASRIREELNRLVS